jgi:hypothetical protein
MSSPDFPRLTGTQGNSEELDVAHTQAGLLMLIGLHGATIPLGLAATALFL